MSTTKLLVPTSTVPPARTTEELLVEKLDSFLSSIESRLDNFEHFFKFRSEEEELLKTGPTTTYLESEHNRSRRGSAANLSNIKTYLINSLNIIHQRLSVIKDSVLKTSFTNLENLYKTLDDQYSYLFTDSDQASSNSLQPTISHGHVLTKEALSKKIIATIQFFDEKLVHVDEYIRDSNHGNPNPDMDDTIFNQLRFFNFNRALKLAENKYIHYYDLPFSWRENKYIINGYRFSLQHSKMIKSIFHFNHNETMNIWTHMIGFGILAYITFIHFPSTKVYQQNSFNDNLAMYGFLAAGMKCLISSVVWHTYSCFAHLPTRIRCACVDYTGITVLITASVISAEYCALFHYPKLLNTYISFSILCGLAGFVFNWSPYFDRPECKLLRIGFFVGLALMGITASFIVCYYEGFIAAFKMFFPMLFKSLSWYWIGVVFYGGMIPERWRYDVIIDDDDVCLDCEYSAADVLLHNVDKAGMDELAHMGEEILDAEVSTGTDYADNDNSLNKREGTSANESGTESKPLDTAPPLKEKLDQIIKKHFPREPKTTPYAKDFLSLWWVDYAFSSHSIWHICVVLGVLGHYSSVLDMFEMIVR